MRSQICDMSWVGEQAKGTEDIQASEDSAQPPAEVKSITEGRHHLYLSSLSFLVTHKSWPGEMLPVQV